jgi:membrane protein insertase Oxa1/YidC/SpoIIIJ
MAAMSQGVRRALQTPFWWLLFQLAELLVAGRVIVWILQAFGVSLNPPQAWAVFIVLAIVLTLLNLWIRGRLLSADETP